VRLFLFFFFFFWAVAAAGSDLALADDEADCTAAAFTDGRGGVKLHLNIVDVLTNPLRQGFAKDVVAQHGRVKLLIITLAWRLHGRFDEIRGRFSLADGDQFYGVVVYGVKIFLPVLKMLKKRARAQIVNIGYIRELWRLPGKARIRLASVLCGDILLRHAPRNRKHLRVCFLRASWRDSHAIARRAGWAPNTFRFREMKR